jgi:hypothetical protein
LSKIGAEPAQRTMSRGGVVNLPVFPRISRLERRGPTRPAISGTSAPSHGVHICDRPRPLQHCGNHGERAIRARARTGLDIAKPLIWIVDRVDEWIADVGFSTKTLFARSGL